MFKNILTATCQISTDVEGAFTEISVSSYEDCLFSLIQPHVTTTKQLNHKARVFYHLAQRSLYKTSSEVAFPCAIVFQIEEGVWDSAIETLQKAGLLAVQHLRQVHPTQEAAHVNC